MGFFSSRKAEPTPIPASEVSSIKVIRSRFVRPFGCVLQRILISLNAAHYLQYGKSKNSSGRSSIAQPPSLLHVPKEATTFNQSPTSSGRHVSANALTYASASRFHYLHNDVSCVFFVCSMSLAQRLNELAVANADNLLK